MDEELFNTDNDIEVFPQGQTVLSTFRTPEQVERTSMLASLAMIKQGQVDISEIDRAVMINKERIEKGEEEALRTEIDQRRKEELEMSLFSDVNELGYKVNLGDDKYALEEQGVDQLVTMSYDDLEQALVNEGFPALTDERRDYATKVAILQSAYDTFAQQYEDNSTLTNVVDFLATMVPFNKLNRESEALGSLVSGLKDPGLFKQIARDKLFDLPLPEFKEKVNEIVEILKDPRGFDFENNPMLNQQIISELIKGTSRLEENIYATLDASDVVLPLGVMTYNVLKKMKNPLQIVKTVNRKLATDTAVGRILSQAPESASVVKTTHAIDMMLPDYARTTNELAVGLSGDILHTLNTNQDMLSSVLNSPRMARLQGAERDAAVGGLLRKLDNQYKPNKIMNTKITGFDETTGLMQAEIYLGKAKGKGGFPTAAGARSSADQRGLLNYNIVHDETSGQFFIRQKYAVPEEGYISAYDISNVGSNRVRAAVTPVNYWGPERLADRQGFAASQQLKYGEVINKKILPQINKLNGADKRHLNDVLELGHEQEKWFNLSELRDAYDAKLKRWPTDDEVKAYYAIKELNDFDYVILNNKMYTDLARQGYNKVNISKLGFEGNGKLLNIDNPEKLRVFDLSAGKKYTPDTPLTKEELKRLTDKDGYVAYKLNARGDLPKDIDGDFVDIVIGKKSDFSIGPLDYSQLPYKAGGHRMYPKNSIFIKQARVFEKSDGSKYMVNPITHGITDSVTEADDYIARYENVRKGVIEYRKGNITVDELDNMFTNTTIRDLDHWDELIENGVIVENMPFERVYDGELPSAMMDTSAYSMLDDVPLDDSTRYMLNRSKKYTGKRGEFQLLNLEDEKARILNPFESLNDSLQHAMRTGAYYDYRTESIESWKATFSRYLKNDLNETANEMFTNPSWRPGTDIAIETKGNNIRNNIIRQLHMRTDADRRLESAKRSVASWVEGKAGVKYQTTKDMLDTNFLSTWRSYARNMYQGFANIGQFALQIQTAVTAVMVSPVEGVKAVRAIPAFRSALGASDELLEQFGKNADKIAGMDAGNFKSMVKLARDSGFLNVGDEAYLFAKSMPSSIGKAKLKGTQATTVDWLKDKTNLVVNDYGNFFLRGAERVNRMTAWGIAYREELAKSGLKVLDNSPESLNKVLKRARTLSFDMDSAGKTILQGGPAGITGQFLQYGVNYADLIFNPANKLLSTKEKMRVIIGSTLMYGGHSVPFGNDGVNVLMDKYSELTGEPVNDIMYRAATSGILDAFIYAISGGEIDSSFGSRAGWGPFVENIVDAAKDKSVLQLAVGPGFKANKGLATAIWDNLHYLALSTLEGSVSGEDLGQAFLDLARTTKTGSDIDKAILLHKGLLATKNGMKLGEGNSFESIAVMLGLPLRQEVESWQIYSKFKSEKEYVGYLAKKMVENNTRAMMTATPESVDYFAKLNNFYMQGEADDVQQAIANEMYRLQPSEFYFELTNRLRTEQPLSNRANAPVAREERREKGE